MKKKKRGDHDGGHKVKLVRANGHLTVRVCVGVCVGGCVCVCVCACVRVKDKTGR